MTLRTLPLLGLLCGLPTVCACQASNVSGGGLDATPEFDRPDSGDDVQNRDAGPPASLGETPTGAQTMRGGTYRLRGVLGVPYGRSPSSHGTVTLRPGSPLNP